MKPGDFRSQFVIDDSDEIYLDGNSLGRLPYATAILLHELVETQWGSRLIRGWNEHWLSLQTEASADLANLLGVTADHIRVCDSTSLNFYKCAMAARRLNPGRKRIVTEAGNFPSDLYLLQGLRDLDPEIEIVEVASEDGIHWPPESFESVLDDRTLLLTLSHVNFRSGWKHDIPRLDRAAHAAGALTLWDLSHSVGAVEIDLRDSDFAVGCTYKYLNGGPGAPAFVFVHARHAHRAINPIWGWFGRKDFFRFDPQYEPAPGVDRFLVSTPPVLSMAAAREGIRCTARVGMAALAPAGQVLVDAFIAELDPSLAVLTPRSLTDRGNHVLVGHPEARRITEALIQQQIIPDYRPPQGVRFGFAPLYNTEAEARTAAQALNEIVRSRSYERVVLPDSVIT